MSQKEIQSHSAKMLVVGLTFKKKCPDIRNTRIANITNGLKTYKCDVGMGDPWVDPVQAEEQYDLKLVSNLENRAYGEITLAVVHEKFKQMEAFDIRPPCKDNSVFCDLIYALNVFESDLRLSSV